MSIYRKTIQVNDLSESRRILQSREFDVPDFGAGLRALEQATDLALPNIIGMAERVLFFVNGPAHLQRRKALMDFFREKNIRHWDGEIRAIAESAVAQLPEAGERELISAFSIPLVALANCRLLGLPEENYRDYNAWASEISTSVLSVLSVRFARRSEVVAALFATDLKSRLAARVAPSTPAPSLFDFLGETLPAHTPEKERIWTLMALYMTGLATRLTFSNVLNRVANSSAEYRQRLLDPDTSQRAFDDLIGQSGAVLHMHRIARQATEVDGVSLAPRDSAIARTVDPDLAPAGGGCPFSGAAAKVTGTAAASTPTQMPFGVGLHKCIGEDFAKRIIRHGITALLTRFPDFRATEPSATVTPIPNISGHNILLCRLDRP
jgi:cytochrome P450